MKTVKEERLSIILTLNRSKGDVSVECRADYEISCYDITVARSYSPELSSAQKTAVKNFGAQILADIKAIEE